MFLHYFSCSFLLFSVGLIFYPPTLVVLRIHRWYFDETSQLAVDSFTWMGIKDFAAFGFTLEPCSSSPAEVRTCRHMRYHLFMSMRLRIRAPFALLSLICCFGLHSYLFLVSSCSNLRFFFFQEGSDGASQVGFLHVTKVNGTSRRSLL